MTHVFLGCLKVFSNESEGQYMFFSSMLPRFV